MKIIDVGCGPGIYVTALRQLGFVADGVDPDPNSPYDKISIFDDKFEQLVTGYDLCICLEVAEHVDEEFAEEFVKRLVSTAPVIIFSAAQPGQGGHGHINCQPKEYWQHKFARQNYVLDQTTTDHLVTFMQQGYHMGWFVNNVQVFKQYGKTCFKQIAAEELPQAQRLAEYIYHNQQSLKD